MTSLSNLLNHSLSDNFVFVLMQSFVKSLNSSNYNYFSYIQHRLNLKCCDDSYIHMLRCLTINVHIYQSHGKFITKGNHTSENFKISGPRNGGFSNTDGSRSFQKVNWLAQKTQKLTQPGSIVQNKQSNCFEFS